MVEESHFEVIKRGFYEWNMWRAKYPDVIPDLIEANLSGAKLRWADLSKADLGRAKLVGAYLNGADLTKASLIQADLSGANLSEAKLSGAKLSEADLFEADLSSADLSGADLSGANLSGVKLTMAKITNAVLTNTKLGASTLIGANLSESDISGANLNNANLSQWIIKGIKCSHIFWKGKRLEFKEGEFEKSFTAQENTIEIILDLPFSEIGYHTGRIIEEVINQTYGEGSVLFKGLSAISDDSTKFDIVSIGTKEESQEIKAKLDNLPSEIEERVIKKLKGEIGDNDHRHLIRLKDEIDIPFTKGLIQLSATELNRRVSERYTTMHPILQQIAMAVQSAIQ